MTTPIIEQIYHHSSMRQFRDEDVPAGSVRTIVAAGQRAATSSNLQMYSVVAVHDRERKERLAHLCGDQEQIRQAPWFLAWCADRSRLDRVCQMRGYEQETRYLESFLVSAVDVALMMQNATLAAESLGLGSCYIGAIRNHPAEVIEELALPELVVPIAGMTLGWPAGEQKARPRLELDGLLHWEQYDTDADADALQKYDGEMAQTGIYEGRQVPVPGKPGEVEAYGWLEHSARRVSRPARQELASVIRRQGFGLL